jgi:exodeoxyribonuclease V alpha subunit
MLRARAGISYALMEAVANGDCGLPRDDLLMLAAKLLEIDGAILAEALRLEIASGGVVEDAIAGRSVIFLPPLHRAEAAIAVAIRDLGAGAPSWPEIVYRRAKRGLTHI